jgi:cytochrome b6-f complex iron-sulfur subunit
MTSQANAPARSRLDAEPVARRDFLGLAAMWSALVTLAFATAGALRLPRAAVVPVPSRKFRVALPEGLAPGDPVLPTGRSVAVFKDASGVWAVSTVCTHLGCVVKRDGAAFSCPCHGSRFALDGTVEKGPAPAPLRWLAVAVQADGSLLVDESETVPEGTKVTA